MTRLPPTRLTRISTPWVVLLLSTTSASSDPSSSECMCGNGWAKCLYPGGESFREGDGGAGAGCGRTGKSCADVCPDSDYRQDQQQSVAAWKTVYREALERGATLEQRCESADTTADWGESQILRDLLQHGPLVAREGKQVVHDVARCARVKLRIPAEEKNAATGIGRRCGPGARRHDVRADAPP